jgi:hypothetical protein
LKIPARVNSLLVVHQRRVDRALAVLQHCNEQLHSAEVERTRQYERLLDIQSRRQCELSRQGEVGAGTSRCALSATGLAAARNRLEWWSARVEEQKKELAVAEAALLKADSDAAQARLRYQEVQARQSGLMRLVDERRRALARDRERLEECDSDGRWSIAAISAACRVESKLG